ncbi:MAG: beta-galactosidase, partial [Flavobacteriaceae bacterium]|nr:beta-galactosidase [Flavobacteriaceae bacterium]
MKINYLFFALFISFYSCSTVTNEKSDRIKTNINRAWQFTFSDESDDFSKEVSVSGNWEKVGLPHSFSLPYFRSESFYTGYGWYQKNLQIDENWIGQSISLEFDGVFQVAEIFINGKKVGENKGGYTGFTVDISNAVKTGENLLAVRVNNLWDAQLAPRAGEHVFSGGIYRDVYLTITNPLHVAWNGTFVTTPQVTKEKASVNIKTEVNNDGKDSLDFTLKSILIDPNGKNIKEISSEYKIQADANIICEQNIEELIKPLLWSPETPNLYQLKTLIYKGESLIDTQITSFGFRWLEWTADKGFFLNGKHLYLEGVNVHQDHAGWGDAITKAGVYRDLKLMKDAGFNMIRGSHYPHHPYFTEVCDQLGLMFIPENCVWGIGGFGEDGNWKSSTYPIRKEDMAAYNESAAKTLKELIQINRNSPSVIAWSMSNEPFFSANEVE